MHCTTDESNKMKNNLQRKFIPGDKWMFFKVYLNPNESNRILLDSIRPFIASQLHKETIDSWFFIRYSDPEYHIRLRLHLSDSIHLGDVVDCLFLKLNKYVKSGVVSKVMLDTYVREIERYGSDNMETCEHFFCQDSTAILEILNKGKDFDIAWDWRLGFVYIHLILEKFLPDLSERLKLVERISDGYNREFGYDSHNLKLVNSMYRKHRPDVECLLQRNGSAIDDIVNPDIDICQDLMKSSNITDILPSLLHMSMNRLYPSNQRKYEMLTYNFLRTYYKGRISVMMKKK